MSFMFFCLKTVVLCLSCKVTQRKGHMQAFAPQLSVAARNDKSTAFTPTRQTVHGREPAMLRLSDAAVVLSGHRVRSLCHLSSVVSLQDDGPVLRHLRFFHHHSTQVQLRLILYFFHCCFVIKMFILKASPPSLAVLSLIHI